MSSAIRHPGPHRTVVIDVVGLSASVIGPHTPALAALAASATPVRLTPPLPAVTCTSQAAMLTGASASVHGIVGNGWYDRSLGEVLFWKQSNNLVTAEKVWQTARAIDPNCSCANLFWWFNMYPGSPAPGASDPDFSVTPRPIYKADGRKLPDCYTEPDELRTELQSRLGAFPLFHFWGPGADIRSTKWIADAAMHVFKTRQPSLSLVYLPHLDYALQRFGPADERSVEAATEVDNVLADLLQHFRDQSTRVLVVSEYGIEPVARAAHPNRVLRQADLLSVRLEDGHELLDPVRSRAFAVCDHQVAHIYIRDYADIEAVAALLRTSEGVERVLGPEEKHASGLDHERSGDLVLISRPGWWFSYQYWLRNEAAPDFARTVDIHRKPGYDPLELFLDPALTFPRASIGWRLFKRRLGLRTLLDVVPLDTSLVCGSHGRTATDPAHRPLLLTDGPAEYCFPERRPDDLPMTAVRDLILACLFHK